MKKLILSLITLLSISYANANTSTLLVSTGITLKNMPALTVYFGKDKNNYYELTSTCKFFLDKKNYNHNVTIDDNGSPDLVLSYTSPDKQLMHSSKYETYTDITITPKTNKDFEVTVSGTLLNLANDEVEEIKPETIILSKKYLDEIRNGCK